MRRRDNLKEVNDLRKMLTETKRLTLEHYIFPEEEEDSSFDEEMPQADDELPKETKGDMSNIESELIQIRKIALSVINRLADQTSSESYDTMKRIWSLVDKAIESKNTEMKNNQQ